MATKKTSPAKKFFCVWADYVRRVCQHVEAESPKQALAIASQQPECWEPCDLHDSNGYRLSNEVQDLATEEFVAVNGNTHCKTCGSEIVETINDSNFREGECGPCEYERYQGQSQTVYTLVVEDFQDVAQHRIGRELNEEELRLTKKYFENGIQWWEVAEIAIDEAVDHHVEESHGTAA